MDDFMMNSKKIKYIGWEYYIYFLKPTDDKLLGPQS